MYHERAVLQIFQIAISISPPLPFPFLFERESYGTAWNRLKRCHAHLMTFSRPSQDLLKTFSRPSQVLLKSFSRPSQDRLKTFSSPSQVLLKSFSFSAKESNCTTMFTREIEIFNKMSKKSIFNLQFSISGNILLNRLGY